MYKNLILYIIILLLYIILYIIYVILLLDYISIHHILLYNKIIYNFSYLLLMRIQIRRVCIKRAETLLCGFAKFDRRSAVLLRPGPKRPLT